jgi:nicotinate-nucleotide adenylyltransferase
MRIGLLGGSFNPPHAAHLLISKTALRRLNLDRVWWLVSPGNPLKDARELAPLEKRIEQARALIDDRRIVPTGVEADLKTGYTVDTIRALQARSPNARFVWLMGADNLAQFHRWKGWRRIAGRVPIAVFDRPEASHTALRSRAALTLAADRIDESDAGVLAGLEPPAWTFIHGPKSPLSSTALRRAKTSRT